MKKLTLIALFLLFAGTIAAQTDDTVTVSRAAAEACVVADKKAKALEIENAVLVQAAKDKDAIIENLKLELARTVGQLTGEQQQNVANRAIIEFLLKNGRVKKYGLINF